MTAPAASSVGFVGSDLARPECVLATRSGDIFVADRRGGISTFRPDGPVRFIEARGRPADFLPNGFAILPDRSFLVANLGDDGGVWHLAQDGTLTPHTMRVDGEPLPPVNFVGIDAAGRTWISVSTCSVPRWQKLRKGEADGFLALAGGTGGARIVAEGIGWTNEAIVDPSGRWLYVNETMARCTSRFPIRADSSLGSKEVVAQYGRGTFPDGFAFDGEGGVWIVSVVSNRVIRVHADARQEIVLEDCDEATIERVERAFDDGSFGQDAISAGKAFRLANLSGIAFGGEDLRTVYLGSLFGTRVATFTAEVAGAPPVHWNF
jgi:sugar lactone lactonase YvrE